MNLSQKAFLERMKNMRDLLDEAQRIREGKNSELSSIKSRHSVIKKEPQTEQEDPFKGIVAKCEDSSVSDADKAKAFDDICDLFAIGSKARTPSVLLRNITNVIDHASKLHAVEQTFFMIDGEPDDYDPDGQITEVCLVNSWGGDTETYVESFGEALYSLPLYENLVSVNEDLQNEVRSFGELIKLFD